MATSMKALIQGLQRLSVSTCKTYMLAPKCLSLPQQWLVPKGHNSFPGPQCLHNWTLNMATRCLQEPLRLAGHQTKTPVLLPHRNKIKYSWNKGKPKTVKSVVNRFYRLHWGMWIRTRSGKHKKIAVKHPDTVFNRHQYVFCNRTQSRLLNRMVTPYWLKRRHYPGDPYEPYHKRINIDGHTYEVPKFLP